jgi:membrane protein
MADPVQTTALKRAVHFFTRGVWLLRPERLPWAQRLGVYAVRFVGSVGSGFRRNQCSLHAASLTFFSLMALVPILVLALALARTFGGANLAKAQIDEHLNAWVVQMEASVSARTTAESGTDRAPSAEVKAAQAEVTKAFSAQVREIVDKLYGQVNTISFGTLGGIGLVMLLWTVIGVLGKVESSFNQIWGVERGRPFVRKFSDYLSAILILPFLITAVSSVPVAAMIAEAMDKTVGGPASATVRVLLNSGILKILIELVLGTLAFAFLLGFMPNRTVKTVPALAGGFVAVVFFGGWLKLCAMLQIGIAKYSALYGGFAVLPILLMWVYTSWQIVLLGSVVSFAVQARSIGVRGLTTDGASPRARLLFALAVCVETARLAQKKDGGPFPAIAYSERLGIPRRFVREVLETLICGGVLAAVADRADAYVLCRSGEQLRTSEIVQVFLNDGESPDALGLGDLDAAITGLGEKLDSALAEALALPLNRV